MKKFILIFLSVIFAIIISLVIFVFAASHPVPEGAEEIIDEVLQREIPEQILGDTGKAVTPDGISIWYESIMPEKQPKGTILLIMGLGGNAIEWPLYFIKPLVSAGYQVIRFDNRGTGLSTWTKEGFDLSIMADDAIVVMDALNIDSVHVFGMSMGGMIGQLMAIENPERVNSLTSFMASADSDDPDLPDISRSVYFSLIATGIRYGIHRTERNIARTTVSIRSILTPELSPTRIKALAEQSLYNQRYRKGFNSAAFIQHTIAIRNADPRYDGLSRLKIPALVIHGKDDPLIPFEHGVKTAEVIPNAALVILEGMGHDVSPEHTPLVHEAFLRLIEQ